MHNGAALIGIISHRNVAGTGQDAGRYAFKCADVGFVAGGRIHHAGIVDCTRLAALIEHGAVRHAGVDRGTTGHKRHRLCWTAIVRKRRKHRAHAPCRARAD